MFRKGDTTYTALARHGSPEEKAAMLFVRGWWEKGYIRNDVYTVSEGDDMIKNKYAVMAHHTFPAIMCMES
jgi:hypothetical protein